MFKILCEASRDIVNSGLILRDDTKASTSFSVSKAFFKQQNNSGLVVTIMVCESIRELIVSVHLQTSKIG